MFRLIASYPKSGNTYVRIFLAHYLRGETDLNKTGWPLFTSRAFWPIGIPPPQKRKWILPPDKNPIYSKTHEIGDFYYGHFVDRAIYIVRHPYDVTPSFARHMGIDNDQAITGISKQDNYLRATEKIYPQFISSWSNHVLSWLRQKRFPVFFIRYETLVSHPRAAFTSMLEFLDVTPKPDSLEASLNFSSFANLQSKEKEMKSAAEKEAKPDLAYKEARGSTGFFFNVGSSGKHNLTTNQKQRILQRHGHVMKLLRYEA